MEISWEKANQSYQGEFIMLGVADQPRLEMLLFALVLACYVMALLGNVTIIVVSRLDPVLNTPMYFFLSNLSFIDLCFTTSIAPQVLINFWRTRKTIPYGACVVEMFICLAMGSTECILLVAMAYDRYAAICHPLRYTSIMSQSVCFMMAAVSWISGFSVSLVENVMFLRLSFCGQNQVDHFFCELPAFLKLACGDISINEVLMFAASVIFLLVPVSLITISYGRIAIAVIQIPSAEGRKKAFKTCSSHLLVVWLFYGTTTFTYLLPRANALGDQGKMIPLFYVFVPSLLNPLIYTLRNKEVHNALQRLMKK